MMNKRKRCDDDDDDDDIKQENKMQPSVMKIIDREFDVYDDSATDDYLMQMFGKMVV